MSSMPLNISWVEISRQALLNNIRVLENCLHPETSLSLCLKANAYGHSETVVAQVVQEHDPKIWLNVHSLIEARTLRNAGIKSPIYIMGQLFMEQIQEAIAMDVRFVLYDFEHLTEAEKQAEKQKKIARVHIKIETGTHRQGIDTQDAARLLRAAKTMKGIVVEGIATHFANIEDISEPGFFRSQLTKKKTGSMTQYPQRQLASFEKTLSALAAEGYNFEKVHCANSAATLLFKETHFSMVRPGVILYGLWPSEAVKKEFERTAKNSERFLPVLAFKTRVLAIKNVAAGAAIGYGCSYKTKKPARIAILTVGYSDGYDRSLSNKGYVLIHGKKAPVRGRIFMNMMIVEVTTIPEAKVEDEATLIGDSMTAELMAQNAGTINYEITTRIREGIPRILVA